MEHFGPVVAAEEETCTGSSAKELGFRSFAVLIASSLALLVTACGGGGSPAPTPTPTPTGPSITSIAVTPNPATATIGGSPLQFAATVSGTGAFTTGVTWSIAAPAGSSSSPGTLSTTGLYTTPYPFPPTVTITATSTEDSTKSGSVTVTLSQPAKAAGPALSVDAGNPTHPISPYIYGMNYGVSTPSEAKAANLSIDRWGGDGSQRYNYVSDVLNAASDWYFENRTGGDGTQANSGFNQQVAADQAVGSKTLGTVNVLGWIAKNATSCSFPSATYPSQTGLDPYNGNCGNGVYPDGTSGCTSSGGCNITGNDPTVANTHINSATWAGAWVTYLVGKFGTAANGGVAIYDLDNEPAWWDAVHRDVHPVPFTYDEATNNGIAVAKAIKAADPTAEVSGPVMDNWWNYFYSKQDEENGWSAGPCYAPWANPTDRKAHGGIPFIEYYLQQFAAASNTDGVRLLDYVDLHTYLRRELQRRQPWIYHRRRHAARSRPHQLHARLLGSHLHRPQLSAAELHHRRQLHHQLQPAVAGPANHPDDAGLGHERLSRHQNGDHRVQLGRAGAHQRRPRAGRHPRHLRQLRPRRRHPLGHARPRPARSPA